MSASASSGPSTQNRESVALSNFSLCFRALLLPTSVVLSVASRLRASPAGDPGPLGLGTRCF